MSKNKISFMILLAGESFPTTIRSSGYGFIFSVGFIGSFVAPFLVEASKSIGVEPMISMGILGLSGCVATFFLEETFDRVNLI